MGTVLNFSTAPINFDADLCVPNRQQRDRPVLSSSLLGRQWNRILASIYRLQRGAGQEQGVAGDACLPGICSFSFLHFFLQQLCRYVSDVDGFRVVIIRMEETEEMVMC